MTSSSISRRFHLAEELLGHCYSAECTAAFTKLKNQRFDVLLQRTASVVLDRKSLDCSGKMNVYSSVEVAHRALLPPAAAAGGGARSPEAC